MPVVRSRAEGISRCASLADKVRAWAGVTGAEAGPLLANLQRLSHQTPEQIAAELLSRPLRSGAQGMTAALSDSGTTCCDPLPVALSANFAIEVETL